MKRVLVVLTVLFVFTTGAFAQMNTCQESGMRNGGWGWAMGAGGFHVIIAALPFSAE